MNTLSLIRWAGGKGRQLGDLLPLIPHSKVYVEPFGGGASVLMNRPRMEVEVYNDLDHALVNLFHVIRDDDLYERFVHQLEYTPYARTEFQKAVDTVAAGNVDEAVSLAVAMFTLMNQGISGKRLALQSEWSRSKTQNLAERWEAKKARCGPIHRRFKGVQIECRDALDCMQEWDSPQTVFYCDPPYVLETRGKQKYYAIEPGDEWHHEMVNVMLELQGMVVLSGYEHAIYEPLVQAGWRTDLYGADAVMAVTKAGGAKAGRVEIVYRNPAAADMGVMRPLFSL